MPPLTDLVLARLAAHSWPGNLRELEAFAEGHVLGLAPWDGAEGARPRPDLPRPDLQSLVGSYEAAQLDAQLGAFQGRMERDRWREQARFLAQGDRAGYEAQFGKLG